MLQPATVSNRTYMTAAVWIIATVALGMVLSQGAHILAPFALAIFIWLVMEGFARAIRRPFPHLPDWLAHFFAMAVVAISIVIFISVLRGAVLEFADKSKLYEAQINDMIKQVYSMLRLTDTMPPPAADAAGAGAPAAAVVTTAQPPTLSQLFYSDTTVGLAQAAANSLSGLVGDMVLIMIYVAFLYVTANGFSRKLDRIFTRPINRERARLIGADVRRTMEQYLWVQTALSIITTVLTYVTL